MGSEKAMHGGFGPYEGMPRYLDNLVDGDYSANSRSANRSEVLKARRLWWSGSFLGTFLSESRAASFSIEKKLRRPRAVAVLHAGT
jgi:hypothetical protein